MPDGTVLAVGLDRPWALPALVPLLGALWYLIERGTPRSETGERPRRFLLASRAVLVACLVLAAAGPYTVSARETPGDPRVTLLVDESGSMEVAPPVADELERQIEERGVPVSTVTIASGNASRIGDAVATNLRPGGSLVLVSDGQVTGGRSLTSAAELARSANATISAVSLGSPAAERYVTVAGPEKTSVGVENRFLVRVGGSAPGGRAVEVTVAVDGERVATRTVEGTGTFEFTHAFNATGEHRVVARVDSADAFGINDVYYRTVRAVEKPRILYVSRSSYPLSRYLSELYDVTKRERVPGDLEPYYAVVIQDMPAGKVGDVDALSRFVINGGGLVVAGGENAFERGGYTGSQISSMLPVRVGKAGGRGASIVLTIDISGSTRKGMRVQKALALDVLSQLGGDNKVGIVAFNREAYRVAPLTPLSEGRSMLEDRIRRLESDGGTDIATGLRGAGQVLGGGGTAILLSDGDDKGGSAVPTARALAAQGTRVITIGVGSEVNTRLLGRIADASGGVFYRANETNRLRIFFGEGDRGVSSKAITVVDRRHFITAGVTTTAKLGRTNRVSVKDGASYLVASASGRPVVSSWRYGLGRVVAITGYGPEGGLDGLLARPDSLLISKSVNWAIGDPGRKRTGVADVPDTRVGTTTTATYRGTSRPEAADVSFARVGRNTYRARFTPESTGVRTLLGATYAVNYPREYAGFGTSPELSSAVETTGGRMVEPSEAGAIAALAKQRARGVREVRSQWDWLLLVVGLLLYLAEVGVRRIRSYRGEPTIP